MEHTIDEQGGVRVVRLTGPVDVSGAMELRDLLGKQLDGPGAKVLVDLSGVTLVDSSGIGIFVTAHRRADQVGGAMVLAAATQNVNHVFELTRTNTLLKIVPSVDEGVSALTG